MGNETEAKVWYKSRTIWLNLIAAIGTISTIAGFDFEMSEEQQVALVGGIITAVNIACRFITKQPVSLTNTEGK